MKRIVLFCLMVFNLVIMVGAQDEEPTLTLQIACPPEVRLPDTDMTLPPELNQPDYSGEQYVRFCVTVQDATGTVIVNPQIENIQIFANSAEGQVPLLRPPFDPEPPGRIPVDVVLVLDSSGSMEGRSAPMQQAAREAVTKANLLNANYAIISFNTQAQLVQSFTANTDLIEAAINGVNPVAGGDTCLYDALHAALDLSTPNPGSRRVVMLFTDGENNDRAGVCKLNQPDEVVEQAIMRRVPIYAVGLTGARGVDGGSLNELTTPTGGIAVLGGLEDLPALFDRVLGQLNGVRILSALVCGRGMVTFTIRATVNEQPVSQALDIDLSSRGDCLAPTPLPSATETPQPTPPPEFAPDVVFAVEQTELAQSLAVVTISIPNRPDIAEVRINIRDSAATDAAAGAQPCTASTEAAFTFDCTMDITALAPGEITLSITPYAADGSRIPGAIFSEDYSKPAEQLVLKTTFVDGMLQVSVNDPLRATGAALSLNLPSGLSLPGSTTFTGPGPYAVDLSSVNADEIMVTAKLSFADSERTLQSAVIRIERTWGQQVARFLQGNSLLIGAVIALGIGGVGWMFWGKRQGLASREDEWLRNSVPEATRVYGKSEAALPTETEAEATRIYSKTAPMGDLELVNLTTDPTRVGSWVSVSLPFIIGRDKNCQLTITDDFLSRRHLSITQQDAMPYLTDLGSSNGTILDGKPLTANTPVLLKHRAEIVLGAGVTLRFHLPEEMVTRMVSVSPKSST